MEPRQLEGERKSRDQSLPRIWLAGRYLKTLFFLLVYGVHAGHHGDELDGREGLVRLLPDPAVCEDLFDHFDDLPLREAVGDFRQATDVQGIGEHASVAQDDLLPQNCQHPRWRERRRTKSRQG